MYTYIYCIVIVQYTGGIYQETQAAQGAGGSATDVMSEAKQKISALGIYAIHRTLLYTYLLNLYQLIREGDLNENVHL